MAKTSEGDKRSPRETERIRDEALKRALSTPPNPHKPAPAKKQARRGAKPGSKG